jgi:hypothetical protein
LALRHPNKWDPELGVVIRKVETWAHDAHDRVRDGAEREGLSEDVRVTAKLTLPRPIADYNDAVEARAFLALVEQPAHQRRRAEHGHNLRRYPIASQPDGFTSSAQRDGLRDVGAQVRNRVSTSPEDLQILEIHPSRNCFGATPVIGLELSGDPDKMVCIWIRQ